MTTSKQTQQYSENVLIEKAKRYCAYAERCSFDVKQKLIQLGAEANSIQGIIKKLSEEQYIDDQRFSSLFATSKLHNNKWGKVKISAELHKRRINESIINKALEGIDEQDYRQCLRALIQKKYVELKNKQVTQLKEKVASYCIQKGFETHLVLEHTDDILSHH